MNDNADVPGVHLLIARHGETRDNTDRLILGRRDPPLSEVGRRQSVRLAERAAEAGVETIWCSPLLRARQTAAIVGDALGIAPAVLDDLIESDRGDWEGRSVADIAARSPLAHAAFEAGDLAFVFPGGESIASQVRRTRAALAAAVAGPGPALIVAHAGTIRAALIVLGRNPGPERALGHGEWVDVIWDAQGGPPS
jgi:broad specificity phosphatase PhoE